MREGRGPTHNGWMPKITERTLKEHRESVRAALLAATAAVVAEGGVAAVNPGSVTARSGLARSTFYKYFATRDDVLAALAVQAMEDWVNDLDVAIAPAEAGEPRMRALVSATMLMTADGRHDLAGALRDEPLHPSTQDDLMAIHDALFRPVIAVLEEMGVDNPMRMSYLVQGLLGSGMKLVEHGISPQDAADDVIAIILRGVRG